MAKVIPLKRSKSSVSDVSGGASPELDSSGGDLSSLGSIQIGEDTEGEPVTTKRISTEALYPASSEIRPELATAFTLLQEGSRYILEAIQCLQKNEHIKSDDAVLKFQALLPELFCCRMIGDGFGSIINAINYGIYNFKGEPLDEIKLKTLYNVVRRLETELFIQDAEAIDEIIKLEKAGFSLEPEYLTSLAEVLNDESFC